VNTNINNRFDVWGNPADKNYAEYKKKYGSRVRCFLTQLDHLERQHKIFLDSKNFNINTEKQNTCKKCER
jgi:hypothetical protein